MQDSAIVVPLKVREVLRVDLDQDKQIVFGLQKVYIIMINLFPRIQELSIHS